MRVDAGLEEIVLRSTLDRQPGGLLVIRFNQDQDWNRRQRVKQAIERVQPLAVWQVQVEQQRRDAVEPLQCVGATSDPFNLEAFVVGMIQCTKNGYGGGCVVLNQQYAFRHRLTPAKHDCSDTVMATIGSWVRCRVMYGIQHRSP